MNPSRQPASSSRANAHKDALYWTIYWTPFNLPCSAGPRLSCRLLAAWLREAAGQIHTHLPYSTGTALSHKYPGRSSWRPAYSVCYLRHTHTDTHTDTHTHTRTHPHTYTCTLGQECVARLPTYLRTPIGSVMTQYCPENDCPSAQIA